ncbi:MAG: PKD domain-containing protein [Bacteroidia bacterium]
MKKNYTTTPMWKLKCFALLLFIAVSFGSMHAQCNANFVYTVNPGGSVSFVSTSTGTVPSNTFYQWNFGDTYTANTAAPTHSYSTNGTYMVQLSITVMSTGTCVSTFTQVVTVTTSPCSSSLTASYTSTIGAGGSVGFTSTSTGTSVSTNYQWGFGDGGTSTAMNPSHTYATNNYYYVKLKLTDGACTDSLSWLQGVTTAPCSLSAAFTSTPGTNGAINFSSASTSTVAGVTYTWNYGDSSPLGYGASPSHTYLVNGNYAVTMTASNSNPSFTIAPCNSTITQTVAVTTTTCMINAGMSYTVNAAGNVSFVSTSTGTTGATTYSWDFGDGNTATGASVSNTYGGGGVHNVFLTVTDGTISCTDTAHVQVNVNTLPCTANSNFTLVPVAPQVWNAIPAYYGNWTSAQWSWGDGNFSSTPFTSHTYSVAGFYNICLNVQVSCALNSTTCASYNIYKMSAAEAANSPDAIISVNVVKPSIVSGINNIAAEKASLSLYPNPANGDFNFKMTDVNSKQIKMEVYNVLGQAVFERSLPVTNGGVDTKLDLGHLPAGAYSVKVMTEKNSYTVKAVISK